MWGAARGLGGVDESALGLHRLPACVGDHQNAIDTAVPLDQALLCSTCEIPKSSLSESAAWARFGGHLLHKDVPSLLSRIRNQQKQRLFDIFTIYI
jgi:hypothetical protein